MQAQDIGALDVRNAIDSYKVNQARFAVKYRGKKFSGNVVFSGVRENMFMRGFFTASFEVQGEKISCEAKNKADVDRLVDLNPGDSISLKGVTDNVSRDTLELILCDYKKI